MEKRDAEYISDDDFKLNENDDGEDLAQLRKYEVNKMRYYFAIVHCNSVKTATRLIEENQGLEFELTNIKLNMSCVDDDLVFPNQPKDVATEIPANYEFNSSNVSRALNHSTVRLSWDQTDKKRQNLLANNYRAIMKRKDDDLLEGTEFDAYKSLIAGSSSESEDVSAEGSEAEEREQKRIEEMRQRLLGGLQEDDGPKRGKLQDEEANS